MHGQEIPPLPPKLLKTQTRQESNHHWVYPSPQLHPSLFFLPRSTSPSHPSLNLTPTFPIPCIRTEPLRTTGGPPPRGFSNPPRVGTDAQSSTMGSNWLHPGALGARALPAGVAGGVQATSGLPVKVFCCCCCCLGGGGGMACWLGVGRGLATALPKAAEPTDWAAAAILLRY